MIAKMLNGPQYCCCNNPPTYLGVKGTWVAVCLQCGRRYGPHRTATLAKKHWNREMKIYWKEWQEKRRAKLVGVRPLAGSDEGVNDATKRAE